MALLPKPSYAHQTWLYPTFVPSWRMSYNLSLSLIPVCCFIPTIWCLCGPSICALLSIVECVNTVSFHHFEWILNVD